MIGWYCSGCNTRHEPEDCPYKDCSPMTERHLTHLIAKVILWNEGCPGDDLDNFSRKDEYLEAARLCARDIGAIP